jgi:hypothetical protein
MPGHQVAHRGHGGRIGIGRHSSIQQYQHRRQQCLNSHNIQGHKTACNHGTRPYPTADEIWARTDCGDAELDNFDDIYLLDFIHGHKCLARRQVENLTLTPFHRALLSCGLQHSMDTEEGHHGSNRIVKACLGYTAAVGARAATEDAKQVEEVRSS